MGYIVAGILIVVVLGVLIAALAGSGNRPKKGTLKNDHDVVVTKPSAEEPTPGESVVASKQQQENARKHTPPA